MSLIELMIAMTIGLVLVGVASWVYLSGGATTRSTLAVARLQEDARLVLELLGRDIRGAGDRVCSNALMPHLLVGDRDRPFWQSFATPVMGAAPGDDGVFLDPALKSGSAVGERTDATDALRLWTMRPAGLRIKEVVDSKAPLAVEGDLEAPGDRSVLLCDFELATLFYATAAPPSLGHSAPRNCSAGFTGYEPCDGGPADPAGWHRYGLESAFAIPEQIRWAVVKDGEGDSILLREVVRDGVSDSASPLASGVEAFRLGYLIEGASRYVAASEVAAGSWGKVVSISVHMTLTSHDGPARDAVAKTFEATYGTRSRLP